jgi:hypothetical protein
MQGDLWGHLVEVKRKCVLRGRKYGMLSDSGKLLAEHQTLYVAAFGNAWLVTGFTLKHTGCVIPVLKKFTV